MTMTVMEAIRGRRSVRRFEKKEVPQALLAEMYEAATWAPSHRNSQPWQLATIGPQTREKLLGMLRSKIDELLASGEVPEPAKPGMLALKEDFGGAPHLIAVSSRNPEQAIDGFEFPLSVAAAIQNMALAGWAHGVGMVWLSLGAAPPARGLLGLAEGDTGIAVLAIGYPAAIPPAPPRQPVAEVLRQLP